MRTVRLGIIGAGFAAQVHAPAFRSDGRCELAAIASGSAERGAAAAAALGIGKAYPRWQELIEDETIEAVTIAVPPAAQAEIVLAALERGKAVFAEKPLAVSLADAERMVAAARAAGVPNMVDFNFTGVVPWIEARRRLAAGAIGPLRHLAVTWHVETRANLLALDNWKTRGGEGGGTLFNFGSHVLHYLEWLAGPLTGLTARRFAAPASALESGPAGNPAGDTFLTLSGAYRSGAATGVAVGTAAFRGSGHRLEFYGAEGTMVLDNPTVGHMRGFTLRLATRGREGWRELLVEDTTDVPEADDRAAPVARLATRFLDWVVEGKPASPDFAEGLRVQALLEAARKSDESGKWLEVD